MRFVGTDESVRTRVEGLWCFHFVQDRFDPLTSVMCYRPSSRFYLALDGRTVATRCADHCSDFRSQNSWTEISYDEYLVWIVMER